MRSALWDERYAASSLVWSATPNAWVEELTAALPPGRVLDLAAGEGRNALWLAERGWDATAVDFSQVALDRARQLAEARLGELTGRFRTEQADLLTYSPRPGGFDLVLVVYLHLPAGERALVMRSAADAVAPGGRMLVVAHDTENLEHGVGGPQDLGLLYTAVDVVEDLADSGLDVELAYRPTRLVETASGPRHAIDAIVLAVRPASDG